MTVSTSTCTQFLLPALSIPALNLFSLSVDDIRTLTASMLSSFMVGSSKMQVLMQSFNF